MYEAHLYIAVAHILLCKLNQAHFSPFQTERFSAVKFDMGYEKIMSFLVISKSPKVWKKKLKGKDWAL